MIMAVMFAVALASYIVGLYLDSGQTNRESGHVTAHAGRSRP